MSRSVVATTATNLAVQFFSALTAVLIARALGPTGRGELATAMVWPQIFCGVAVLGMDVAFGRLAAEFLDAQRQVFNAIVRAVLVVSASAVAIGFLVLPFLLPVNRVDLVQEARFILLVAPFSLFSALLSSAALGLGKHYYFNSIRLLYGAAYLIAVAIVVMIGQASVHSIAICFVASAGIAVAYAIVAMRSVMFSTSQSTIKVTTVIGIAAPFGFASIIHTALLNAPVAYLSRTTSSHDVGNFAVATVAAGAHLALGGAIGKILFARLSSIRGSSEWFVSVFRQTVLLYVAMAIAISVAMPLAIPLLFGSEFYEAGLLAVGLALATSLLGLASVLEEYVRARGQGGALAAAKASALICLLLGYFLLGDGLAAYGMVFACIFSAGIQFVLIGRQVAASVGTTLAALVVPSRTDLKELVSRVRGLFIRAA